MENQIPITQNTQNKEACTLLLPQKENNMYFNIMLDSPNINLGRSNNSLIYGCL